MRAVSIRRHVVLVLIMLNLALLALAFRVGAEPGVSGTIAAGVTRTVTNTNDSGPGSLRQALADANDGDVIDFDLTYPATITLTSG